MADTAPALNDRRIVVAERGHAKCSPSGSYGWMNCEGWINSGNAGYDANWGTAAHEIASLTLTDRQHDASAYEGYTVVVAGQDFPVDQRMIEYVQFYVDTVLAIPADVLEVESTLPLEPITGEVGAECYSDTYLIHGDTLTVVDLKTGRVRVSADSPQLKMYAKCVLELVKLLYVITKIRLLIVQPAWEEVDEHWVTPEELEMFSAEARFAASRKLLGTPREADFNPGIHCSTSYCGRQGSCPAQNALVLSEVAGRAKAFEDLAATDLATVETVVEDAFVAGADISSNEALGLMGDKLDIIRAWCDAVEEKIEAEIKAGNQVPGFKMVAGRKGHRKWIDEEAVVKQLKSLRLKQDEIYERSVIGVPAAEKRFKKDDPKAWVKIEKLFSQPEGKPKLVRASASGQPLTFEKPGSAFYVIDGATGSVIDSPNLAASLM